MFAKLVKIHKSIVNDVYYTNVTYRCPLVVSLLVYFSNDISGNPVWAIRVGSLRLHINGILYSRFISSASAPTNSQNLSNFIITTWSGNASLSLLYSGILSCMYSGTSSSQIMVQGPLRAYIPHFKISMQSLAWRICYPLQWSVHFHHVDLLSMKVGLALRLFRLRKYSEIHLRL